MRKDVATQSSLTEQLLHFPADHRLRFLLNLPAVSGKLTSLFTDDDLLSHKMIFIYMMMTFLAPVILATAPVSQPAMFQKCLSPGQRTVSCSAEGEHTHFSFSLDNNPLLHTKPTSENNGSVTISLNGQLQGNLECKVQNKVSSKQIIVHLSSCEETRFPAVIVLASATVLLLLLVLFLGIELFKVKIRRSPTTITEGDAEEEIVYSDVRVNQAARKRDG
ncbi:uncharacterized protein LOC103144899 isoform X4 [Poecilia formosa]|uniref:uncharacterized protein LOC103144899 isoform X4 n=1 Tax=Poecilia formosa TaxID=48698 RepID=UPI00044474AC|nr:PREDICTED: uncharacterized protein LOC103144899 isoform X4 [Poecilia formosa]